MPRAISRLPPPKREADQSVIVTVRMPLTLVKRLDAMARREACTRSQIVQTAARSYAERHAA
jgi:metal-responsive CopG/Arc/MetJ family transcriptional regulator